MGACMHLDVRRERVVCQLEPNLIIALASGTVRDVLGTLRDGNLALSLCNARARDCRAQQVPVMSDSGDCLNGYV